MIGPGPLLPWPPVLTPVLAPFSRDTHFLARVMREGSMMPPRRRRTKWSVDSAHTPNQDNGSGVTVAI